MSLRRVAAPAAATVAGARTLVGVAPVIFFPSTPKLSKEAQVAKNTKLAVQITKKFKGPVPEPYVRKHTATIEQIEREVEALVGGAEKMRKPLTDDQPMDKMALMERCLRHGIWSYKKDNGQHNFEQYKKWLVYTPNDEHRVNQLRREVELKEKHAALKARRAADNGAAISTPVVDWAKEYAAAVDREVVAEKRYRYDQLASNTRDRDEAQLAALAAQYVKPTQEKRLDDLVELLERFKPVLAREAILQRLAVKHLEGQLGVWRYLDWCPEVRDRAELEVDNQGLQWWMTYEEKRLAAVRLRSKVEVAEIMDKAQTAEAAKALAAGGSSSAAKEGSSNETRDKLLREVLALQARINARDDEKPAEAPKAAKGHH